MPIDICDCTSQDAHADAQSNSIVLIWDTMTWTHWTTGTQTPLGVPILQLATVAGRLGHSWLAAVVFQCQHGTSYSLSWDILEYSIIIDQQRILREDNWQPERTHCGVLVNRDMIPLP